MGVRPITGAGSSLDKISIAFRENPFASLDGLDKGCFKEDSFRFPTITLLVHKKREWMVQDFQEYINIQLSMYSEGKMVLFQRATSESIDNRNIRYNFRIDMAIKMPLDIYSAAVDDVFKKMPRFVKDFYQKNKR